MVSLAVVAPTIEVCGAGEPHVNGLYELDGEHNGTPRYRKDKHTTIEMMHNKFWGIHLLLDREYRIAHPNEPIYFGPSKSEGHSCPLTGWRQNWDSVPKPAPTLRVVQAAKKRKHPSVTAAATQDRVWKQRKFTDAEIVCSGSGCDSCIPVHRSTLSAASPVFDAAFSSEMREGQMARYEIKDASGEAVEAMLLHIYTGRTDVAAELLPDVFELAARFELVDLMEATSAAMLNDVTAECVKARMQCLKRHSSHEQIEKTLKELCKVICGDQTHELVMALA